MVQTAPIWVFAKPDQSFARKTTASTRIRYVGWFLMSYIKKNNIHFTYAKFRFNLRAHLQCVLQRHNMWQQCFFGGSRVWDWLTLLHAKHCCSFFSWKGVIAALQQSAATMPRSRGIRLSARECALLLWLGLPPLLCFICIYVWGSGCLNVPNSFTAPSLW